MFFGGATIIAQKMTKYKTIQWLGKNLFSIYLLHMPFAGIMTTLGNKAEFGLEIILRPFVVLFLTSMSVLIYVKFLGILKGPKIQRYGKMFIGMRI